METLLLAATNRSVGIIEVVVVVVVVALLFGIVVSSRRRKKAALPKPVAQTPDYYADLQQQPPKRQDPFGTFATAAPPAFGDAQGTNGSPAFGDAQGTNGRPATASGPAATTGAAYPNPQPAWPSAAWSPDPSPAGGALDSEPRAPAAPTGVTSGIAASGVAASGILPTGFSSGVAATGVAATGVVPLTASPPAGTPAGWLPDPSGTPDTLRYWDGNAWTQHFAQRT